MVGVKGFEPSTGSSQSYPSTTEVHPEPEVSVPEATALSRVRLPHYLVAAPEAEVRG